ncbi:circadian clock protein KaiB [Thalassomonas haliotis]|uniref:Circadian clock protein KaiB n=1 Tax=Thalassomonas haliotis TaxID=485448 RepID=A0ABY7V7W2_9GAMM|nr:circadian clock protein KaiB [Thalassomonas haliotis]WDE09701.1 circadian clock protein KaiB [Thalassomonas haliotis]
MKQYQLRLYVTGETRHSLRAIDNLRALCDEHGLNDDYEVTVIDVLQQPQLAEDDKIIATPTLVKLLPPPLSKIIGDLSDTDKVLLGLDLVAKAKDQGGNFYE